MEKNFKGRHLKLVSDFTVEEIEFLFKYTVNLKLRQKTGAHHDNLLRGKTLAMIFEKPSTRTRVSFEVGMLQLGGFSLYLSSSDLQLGRGETIADTARVLSRYVDGIMARVYAHNTIEELASHSTVPVINGLSDKAHPCQALADMLTIQERFKSLKGVRMAYVGDGNNVANSLINLASITGVHLTIATPFGYEPDAEIMDEAGRRSSESGARIYLTQDPIEAATGVNVVYTDVWASMGQEDEAARRREVLLPYQVSSSLLKVADPDVIVMHCLPAHREEEITNEVIDGPHSVVWDQAENRLHVQKAILALLMETGASL